MQAHIIYYNYLTPDGKKMSVGGIQTYIQNLIPVLTAEGYQVHIYQRGDFAFEKKIDDVQITAVEHHEIYGQALFHKLFQEAEIHIDKKNDILIFGTDAAIVPCAGYHSIAIQHGISWDIPEYINISKLRYLYFYIKKAFYGWKTIQRASLVDQLVCVDYNFVNWFRSLVLYPKVDLRVIPNFSEVPLSVRPVHNDNTIRIIFARRMQIYRGTRLFAHTAKRILGEFNNIKLTIAGDGPDEQYIKEYLGTDSRIQYITYESTMSLQIHQDQDIAVVPTTGSEGTSLSLLEAMACGCAVICTNVGGMTNIVINEHNGLMIEPKEEKLYQALRTLITNTSLRHKLSQQAAQTVKDSFTLTTWKNNWSEIIREIKKHD